MDDELNSSKAEKSNFYWSLLLVLTLGIVMGVLIHRKWVADQSIKVRTTTEYVTRVNTAWKPMESAGGGFPIYRKQSGLLNIYDFDTKNVRETEIRVRCCDAVEGQGTTAPLVSPDFRHTAYIGDDGLLYLIANGTLEKQAVSNGPVDYITAWSPNSSLLLYRVREDTIESRLRDDADPVSGASGSAQVTFDRLRVPGFYIFDIRKGTTVGALPLGSAHSFITDNTIFFTSVSEGGTNTALNEFNTSTYSVTHALATTTNQVIGQFDVSPDGRFWTFVTSRGIGRDTTLTYAPYPSLTGTAIQSGLWASLQSPKISPGGSRIAYLKNDSVSQDGSRNNFVYLYDPGSGASSPLVEAEDFWWINDTQMIIEHNGHSLFNVYTRRSTAITEATQ